MKPFLFFGIPILLFAFFFYNTSIVESSNRFFRNNIVSCAPPTNLLDSLQEISINENRESAGVLKDGILYVDLEARTGAWFPETHDGNGLRIHAFAEKGKPMQLPGPLIRVPEGTLIKARIKNSIHEAHDLILYGFYSRPGYQQDSIVIAPGEEKKIEFKAGIAGTYFYRGKASDSITDDNLPFFNDSQLYGAFIIDPIHQKPDPTERIFMIGVWNDTTNGPTNGGEELVLNGLSWPYTEQLTYRQNQTVNWRIIDASNQPHPMHLHGFYFSINSHGKINRDSACALRRQAVTQLINVGETMHITWKAEREGNWLFHCHTLVHIMPGSFLRQTAEMNEQHMNDINHHARDGMGGLIMGIHILPNPNAKKMIPKNIPEKQMTIVIGEHANYFDTLNGKGILITNKKNAGPSNYNIPGPPLILYKDQPTAIKIINRLKEPTTMHWHGLEIESYYDGAAGWGNRGNQIAPLIMPGDSFIAHITPPRAGTFIYHTHMHNFQLLEGLCGPLIVLDLKQKFDPSNDKIFFISQGDENFERRLYFINGSNKSDTQQLKAGRKYRLRFVNITALGVRLNVSLLQKDIPVKWKLIAKDGAAIPSKQQTMELAFNHMLSIGETCDFEFIPRQPGEYILELRRNLVDRTLSVKKVFTVK